MRALLLLLYMCVQWLLLGVFPASGQRSWTVGELVNVGTNGRCWKSSSNGLGDLANRGSDLNSNSTNVNPQNTGYRAEGFPVRCVQAFTKLWQTE